MIQSVIDFFGGLEKSMAPVKRFEVEQAAKDKREKHHCHLMGSIE